VSAVDVVTVQAGLLASSMSTSVGAAVFLFFGADFGCQLGALSFIY